MNQKTGTDFRKSLEAKIITLHGSTGIPITTIRKTIAFNRFLARLVVVSPGGWVLKGGFFMQLKFHQKPRTTLDIDLLFIKNKDCIRDVLIKAGREKLTDWFEFQVGSAVVEAGDQDKTLRFRIESLLDSRTFESFFVDVNSSDILLGVPEVIPSQDSFSLNVFSDFIIPCYSLPQQIAEKFHALTKSYGQTASSRVKDLIDILVIAGNKDLEFFPLRDAILKTFKHRHTHPVPVQVPRVLEAFSREYSALAKKVGVEQKTLAEAHDALIAFLQPILSGETRKRWVHEKGNWV